MSEPRSAFTWLKQTWTRAPPILRRHWTWLVVGGAVLGFVLVLAFRPGAERAAPQPQPKPSEPAAVANEGGGPGRVPAGSAKEAPAEPGPVQPPLAERQVVDAGPPLSPNVKLTFSTYPPRRASVSWGAKRLGFIDRGRPLVVERPRDSGPLDVIIRAQGYLPVHARAYTFNDATVEVRITPVEKKETLYGFQQPVTDAGVP